MTKKPLAMAGPGDRAHENGIHVVHQYLTEHGWAIVKDYDAYAYGEEERYPDVIAERKERVGGRVKTMRIIVEVESQNRKAEMAAREAFYTDSIPRRADGFYVVPMWRVANTDSFSSILKIVRECLP